MSFHRSFRSLSVAAALAVGTWAGLAGSRALADNWGPVGDNSIAVDQSPLEIEATTAPLATSSGAVQIQPIARRYGGYYRYGGPYVAPYYRPYVARYPYYGGYGGFGWYGGYYRPYLYGGYYPYGAYYRGFYGVPYRGGFYW